MSLTDESKLFLESMKAVGFAQGKGAFVGKSAVDVRKMLSSIEGISEPLATHPKISVEDKIISHGNFHTPVKIYRPLDCSTELLPVLFYIHGGGWVLGDLIEPHPHCLNFSLKLKCVVISIDYKLAPEYKFPYAPLECVSLTEYFLSHAQTYFINSLKSALIGTSAGANLCAVVAQNLKNKFPFLAQVLVYPVLDLRCQSPSFNKYAEGFFLTKEDMKWFVREYLNSEEEALNPLASPIFQADLSGLPATLFIQAENDPIADDAIVYALSLERAGVTVESDPGEGLIHCYFTLFNEFPNAISEATNKIIYFLKKQGYCS